MINNVIKVFETTGENAVTENEGLGIFTLADNRVAQLGSVFLDFDGVLIMTASFTACSVGKLYAKYAGQNKVKIAGLTLYGSMLVNMVIANQAD